MIKIAHLGFYGTNVGDNAALVGIREQLNPLLQDAQWTNLSMTEFHACRNKIEFCAKRFHEVSRSHDLIIIGGGGLIEFNTNTMNTKWKLPFNPEILAEINIPIVCHSVGVNNFGHGDDPTEENLECLRRLVNQCLMFSVRSDGSLEKMQSFLPPELASKVRETPDPAVITTNQMVRKHRVRSMVFQPALNTNPAINDVRFKGSMNKWVLEEYLRNHNIQIMPHTGKDYQLVSKRFLFKKEYLKENIGIQNHNTMLSWYKKFDMVVAMRGHGQMITVGMNMPGIYLSTQDKVKGFSKKADLMDYTLELGEDRWLSKMHDMIRRLQSDRHYLKEWYAKRKVFVQAQEQLLSDFNKDLVAGI